MMTQDLIDYYTNLLIVQYERGGNARGTVAAYVGAVLANQLVAQVGDGFNFKASGPFAADSAVGPQLETLAQYRGLGRNAYGLSRALAFWKMPIYGDAGANTDIGFSVYGNPSPPGKWLTLALAVAAIYSLTDSELSLLLQLRAQAQSAFLSVQQVDNILYSIFGSKVGVFESNPMEITYADLTSDTANLFDIAVLTKSLPRPAGVKLLSERLTALAGEWGYQIYGVALNPAFVGYGLYGTPQMGVFMRYF
jgi:hypothetical protein